MRTTTKPNINLLNYSKEQVWGRRKRIIVSFPINKVQRPQRRHCENFLLDCMWIICHFWNVPAVLWRRVQRLICLLGKGKPSKAKCAVEQCLSHADKQIDTGAKVHKGHNVCFFCHDRFFPPDTHEPSRAINKTDKVTTNAARTMTFISCNLFQPVLIVQLDTFAQHRQWESQ